MPCLSAATPDAGTSLHQKAAKTDSCTHDAALHLHALSPDLCMPVHRAPQNKASLQKGSNIAKQYGPCHIINTDM